MLKLLSLIFGNELVYSKSSLLIAVILRARGLSVGKNFYIEGIPYLKIRGSASDIRIADNVRIYGDIDIRNRENGKILIGNNVIFDTNCRLIAANTAVLTFSDGVEIGGYTIFNSGTDIFIDKNVITGAYCHFQSSNHGIALGTLIKLQKHTYAKIVIGEGSWIGGGATILPGVTIHEGAVVGAKSVVTKDLPGNSISVGNPARVIGHRE